MDCSLPGSSVHGTFQARVLEWGAITFSMKHACMYIFIEKSEKYTDTSVLTKHKSSVKSVDFFGQVQGKILE